MRLNQRVRNNSRFQPYAKQGGTGIFSSIGNLFNTGIAAGLNAIPASNDAARPSFKGEKHAILKLSNGLTGVANYMGPGTHIEERIARGDPPRTESDKVAQAHDLRYSKAKTVEDIRFADNKMLAALARIKKNRSDSRFNISQGKLIALKISLEKKGLLKAGSFGDLGDQTRVMTPAMTEKLKELDQAGYGKKIKDEDPIVALRKKMLKFSMK